MSNGCPTSTPATPGGGKGHVTQMPQKPGAQGPSCEDRMGATGLEGKKPFTKHLLCARHPVGPFILMPARAVGCGGMTSLRSSLDLSNPTRGSLQPPLPTALDWSVCLRTAGPRKPHTLVLRWSRCSKHLLAWRGGPRDCGLGVRGPPRFDFSLRHSPAGQAPKGLGVCGSLPLPVQVRASSPPPHTPQN